jgi:NADP-dependent 3-hydroxy acid dehydrogenase YdfG
MRDPRTILITGASSGIGEALAEAYAGPGISLALTGRDRVRLDAVAARCMERGAAVRSATVNVADRAAMADWLAQVDAVTPVDLCIANAGISGGTGGGGGRGGRGESEEQARRILAVNVDGVLNMHMFTKPTGIFINPATCASTIAGTSRGRRQAPPPGGGTAVGV